MAEFINREYEIRLVTRPDSPRFVLVDGPAKFGKTYFLRELQRKWEKKRWCSSLARMDKLPAGSINKQACLTEIARNLTCLDPRPERAVSIPNLATHMARAATAEATRERSILLLIDSLHALPDRLTEWVLCDLVATLEQRMERVGVTLRCLISGRYVVRQWHLIRDSLPAERWAVLPRYEEVDLTPFTLDVVRDQLVKMVVSQKLGPLPQTIDLVAKEYLTLSGGHPQILRHLIDELDSGVFLEELDPMKADFYFSEKRKRKLFKVFVPPGFRQEILEGVDQDIQNAARLVSVFRGFNPDILDALFVQYARINDFLAGWPITVRDGEVITAELERYKLVSSPEPDYPLFSDRIVRRLLALEMRFTDADLYESLHICAEAFFGNWASGRTIDGEDDLDRPFSGALQLRLMVEALYHQLKLLEVQAQAGEGPVSLNAFLGRLELYVPMVRGDFPGQLYDDKGRTQLREMLSADREIEELFTVLVGESGLAEIRRAIAECCGMPADQEEKERKLT